MTKERHPLTAYRALARIADLIGWDGCATVAGKSEWTIRKYADPDTEREISLQDSMRLDLAFRRAGGDGAPLFEAYAARMDIELSMDQVTELDFVQASRDAARESGEALDHAISVAAGKGNVNQAIRETGEAVTAWLTILNKLTRMKGSA